MYKHHTYWPSYSLSQDSFLSIFSYQGEAQVKRKKENHKKPKPPTSFTSVAGRQQKTCSFGGPIEWNILWSGFMTGDCKDRWARLRMTMSLFTYALHATSSIKHAVGTRNNPSQKCAELSTMVACKKQEWHVLILVLSKTDVI